MAQAVFAAPPKGWAVALNLVRLDRLNADPWLNPGFSGRLLMLAIVGFGILLIAGINFVNLFTARSARRAKEVSVRKLAGAQRRVLMLQFLTESIVYVIGASVVAVALTELLLPYANAFLIAGATFRYWQDPALIGAIVLVTLLLGTTRGCLSGPGAVGFPSTARSDGGDPPVARGRPVAPDPRDRAVLRY